MEWTFVPLFTAVSNHCCFADLLQMDSHNTEWGIGVKPSRGGPGYQSYFSTRHQLAECRVQPSFLHLHLSVIQDMAFCECVPPGADCSPAESTKCNGSNLNRFLAAGVSWNSLSQGIPQPSKCWKPQENYEAPVYHQRKCLWHPKR